MFYNDEDKELLNFNSSIKACLHAKSVFIPGSQDKLDPMHYPGIKK